MEQSSPTSDDHFVTHPTFQILLLAGEDHSKGDACPADHLHREQDSAPDGRRFKGRRGLGLGARDDVMGGGLLCKRLRAQSLSPLSSFAFRTTRLAGAAPQEDAGALCLPHQVCSRGPGHGQGVLAGRPEAQGPSGPGGLQSGAWAYTCLFVWEGVCVIVCQDAVLAYVERSRQFPTQHTIVCPVQMFPEEEEQAMQEEEEQEMEEEEEEEAVPEEEEEEEEA